MKGFIRFFYVLWTSAKLTWIYHTRSLLIQIVFQIKVQYAF